MGRIDQDRAGTGPADPDRPPGRRGYGRWAGVLLILAGLAAVLAILLPRQGVTPEGGPSGSRPDTATPSATDGAGRYYESIDLVDAYHPQTILAYAMNGATLPVRHGAPLRLRVERQLGYKHAKYVMRVEAVASLESLGRGQGGFWPDRGYEWYAGI